jgi:Cu-Zn family superoxide dismutase
MHRLRMAAIVVALLIAGAAALAAASPDSSGQGNTKRAAATLINAAGQTVGGVAFEQRRGTIVVRVRTHGLPAGFHGFHVHAVGRCQAPDFMSAMGHLKRGAQVHGQHIGDMPVLLVNRDGTARARFVTDRFTLADLRDGDGSAAIVHANPDNYANIPQRYDPDPDQETLNTGDAGSRLACGVVR